MPRGCFSLEPWPSFSLPFCLCSAKAIPKASSRAPATAAVYLSILLPIWSRQSALLSWFSPVQLFVTPWTVACQAPLSLGFSRQEHQSGSCALLQGNFLTQGLNSMSVKSSALVGGFFTTSATWETPKIGQMF